MLVPEELLQLKATAMEALAEYQDSVVVLNLAREASTAALTKMMEAKAALDLAANAWANDVAPPPAA